MITVAVADDEEQICLYVRRIVDSAPDIETVGHSLDGAEALLLVQRQHPDVLLLDVRMPGTDGLSALEQVRALPDPPAVVMLTNFNDDQVVLRALTAGAAGFMLKSASPADLLSVVRLAASGHRVIGAGVGLPEALIPPAPPVGAGLTSRERDVLSLLGKGLSNADIASRMHVSEATVKGHVSSMMGKLRCESRLQLGRLGDERQQAIVDGFVKSNPSPTRFISAVKPEFAGRRFGGRDQGQNHQRPVRPGHLPRPAVPHG